MVGHTGVWDAAVQAAEIVDGCLGRVVERDALGAEREPCCASPPTTATPRRCAMRPVQPQTGTLAEPGAARARRPSELAGRTLHDGVLADVAPTLLRSCVGVPPPRHDRRSLTGR